MSSGVALEVNPCQENERPTFEAVWPTLQPFCRNLSRRYYVPGMDADDMAQTLALRLWRALPRHDPERGSVEGYGRLVMLRGAQQAVKTAFADCRRVYIRALRLDATWPDDATRPLIEPETEDPGYRLLEDLDWQDGLIEAARLSPLERAAFDRLVGNNYSPGLLRAVAADLNVSLKAVDNARTRARGKIGTILALREPWRIRGGFRVKVGWRSGDGMWYQVKRWSSSQPDCYESETPDGRRYLIVASRVRMIDARPWGGRAEQPVTGFTSLWCKRWRQQAFGW